jgi:hypothetical protein
VPVRRDAITGRRERARSNNVSLLIIGVLGRNGQRRDGAQHSRLIQGRLNAAMVAASAPEGHGRGCCGRRQQVFRSG